MVALYQLEESNQYFGPSIQLCYVLNGLEL